MVCAAWIPPCIAPWATPGRRPLGLPRLHGRVAHDEDLGMAGDGQVRLDEDAAVAVRLGAQRGRAPGGRTTMLMTPAPHRTVRAGMVSVVGARRPSPAIWTVTCSVVDADDLRAQPDGHAEALELALGRRRLRSADRPAGSAPSPRRG